MVNEIPDLADQLAASIEQMADHGELHALASKLPFREYRTAEFLNRQPVVADRFDVMTVVQRLQVAGELAAAVAVDLDQSMPVTIELQQPGGLAAYEARAAAARIDPHAALVQQVTDSGYARQVADGMHAEISEAAPLISAPIPTKPSRQWIRLGHRVASRAASWSKSVTGAIGKPGVTAPPTIGAASANHAVGNRARVNPTRGR
jgi:hypothetical protein